MLTVKKGKRKNYSLDGKVKKINHFDAKSLV